jgi:hypothetical protein
MAFNFVKFTDTETSFAATVTIRSTGQIGFSAGALNLYKIGDYGHCILYFDQDRRVVGMELTAQNCEGAMPIKKAASNTHLRAKNFCDRFGINYEKSRRYRLKKDAESGFLYFELENEEADVEPDENRDTEPIET